MSAAASIHACALIVGEAGLLIRGASGAGKSGLVLALIAAAQAEGRFARLVADDRVMLRVVGGRLLAAPHPKIAGLIEQRGTGILKLAHEGQARLTHIVDLAPEMARLPSEDQAIACLEGVTLHHLTVPATVPLEAAARRILAEI